MAVAPSRDPVVPIGSCPIRFSIEAVELRDQLERFAIYDAG